METTRSNIKSALSGLFFTISDYAVEASEATEPEGLGAFIAPTYVHYYYYFSSNPPMQEGTALNSRTSW